MSDDGRFLRITHACELPRPEPRGSIWRCWCRRRWVSRAAVPLGTTAWGRAMWPAFLSRSNAR